VNFNTLTGDDRLLEGSHTLTNHGYSVFSYGQAFGTLSGAMQAFVVDTALENIFSVISANEEPSCGSEFCYPPPDQEWSMNVLVRGMSKLDDAPMRATFRTGESGIMASARVLPANLPRGGYDQADVRVEIERPMIGLGQTLLDVGQQAVDPTPGGHGFDPRTAALASTSPIQTTRQSIVLNDDGVNGDVHAANAQWSAQFPTLSSPARVSPTVCIACILLRISRRTAAPPAASSCARPSWTSVWTPRRAAS
jgi:hypothetical protein